MPIEKTKTLVDHKKNIIEVKDIDFSYGEHKALEDITFNVHKGDYIGLVGPNGAGKTTLLKVMVGLLTPQKGTIKIFGEDIKNFKSWQKIGYVPQKPANFDTNFPATVKEVVAMGRFAKAGLFKRMKDEDKAIIEKSLKQVDMWHYQDRLIGDLSGGQQQRVFLARALASEPEIIFLDEPTANIDKKSQDEFYALLKELNAKMGLTLVLVSHDIERITKEAMHILCVDKNLVCHTSPADFIKESLSTKIFGKSVKIMSHHHHE